MRPGLILSVCLAAMFTTPAGADNGVDLVSADRALFNNQSLDMYAKSAKPVFDAVLGDAERAVDPSYWTAERLSATCDAMADAPVPISQQVFSMTERASKTVQHHVWEPSARCALRFSDDGQAYFDVFKDAVGGGVTRRLHYQIGSGRGGVAFAIYPGRWQFAEPAPDDRLFGDRLRLLPLAAPPAADGSFRALGVAANGADLIEIARPVAAFEVDATLGRAPAATPGAVTDQIQVFLSERRMAGEDARVRWDWLYRLDSMDLVFAQGFIGLNGAFGTDEEAFVWRTHTPMPVSRVFAPPKIRWLGVVDRNGEVRVFEEGAFAEINAFARTFDARGM